MMRLMDGFDINATVAATLLRWGTVQGTASWVTGVFGKGKAIQPGGSGSSTLIKVLGANFTLGNYGFHFFLPAAGYANGIICAWLDATNTQMDLRINSSNQLFFTRNGTLIGAVSSWSLITNSFYWIEPQGVISSTVGVASVWVSGFGGSNSLIQSGLNTQSTANAFFNAVQLGGTTNGSILYDNFHFWDSAAGDVTAYPYGEHIIDTQMANAVGSSSSWAKGGTILTNNFQQVNEVTEDGDTTYVASSTAGQIDSYGFGNLAETSGSIGTIAIDSVSRVDDAPTVHTYEHYCKSGASVALGPVITPGASYLIAQSFQGVDPATGIVWTIAGRNAAQFGIQDIS